MPTEDELRTALRAQPAQNRLDPGRIVGASRRRRVPQQLAAGAMGTLAVAGIAVLGIQTAQLAPGGNESASSPMVAEDSQLSQEGAARVTAQLLNPCGAPLADVAPSATGLELEVVSPLVATPAAGPVVATVRLTNTGAAPVQGMTAVAPIITLSQDGVVLWHSHGPMVASARVIDLKPGEWVDYTAEVEPVRCDPEHDLLEQFPPDLPPLPRGTYQLSAAIGFIPQGAAGSSEPDLVTGPIAVLRLQ